MGVKPLKTNIPTKTKKIKKNFFVQNGIYRRKNRFKNFFGKKSFFLGLGRFFGVDLGQKNVRNFFFIFRLQLAQFVQKNGLEIILRLFVRKSKTLEAYISEYTHLNIFWTTFLESESQNKSMLKKSDVTHVPGRFSGQIVRPRPRQTDIRGSDRVCQKKIFFFFFILLFKKTIFIFCDYFLIYKRFAMNWNWWKINWLYQLFR